MAILTKGIHGTFRGKAGQLVGKLYRGQNVLTGLHEKSSVAASTKQIDQRIKFGLVNSFLSYFSDLINIGFKPQKRKHSPMNMAVSYNIKYAIAGAEIVFPKLSISRGGLSIPISSSAEALTGAILKLTWATFQFDRYNNTDDQLMIMVYNPAKKQFVTRKNVADRKDLMYSLQLPLEFIGDEVHCYLSFTNRQRQASNSVYIGIVTITQ